MSGLDNYISTSEAEQLTGYKRQYIANLLQGGKIDGRKIGGRWLVNRESILKYKTQQDKVDKPE